MKRFLMLIVAYYAATGYAGAAVRDAASVSRAATTTTIAGTKRASSQPATTQTRTATSGAITPRNSTASVAVPVATSQSSGGRTARTIATPQTTAARASRTAVAAPRVATNSARTAIVNTTEHATRASRAASSAALTIAAAGAGNTFDSDYNTCRDAYFTCMDQFCAKQNDTYRRCICSSRLAEIQSREKVLSQTSDEIQDFKDLNISAITKTAAEVNAMLTSTAGEIAATNANDTSASNSTLAGISSVLANTKSKSLSTAGTLDIAGDINAIWATTSLTSGASIANTTGETLYNAVHSQCAEMVAATCGTQSRLNMVVSAYGMYIENDCTVLATALDKNITAAKGKVRETEREMNTARLQNYDAHNSSSINDCIAQVRKDITSDSACGTDYVHCLDISGKYLNRETGEPIYSADFYQLETQISLSGDILTNQSNRLIVAELNRKRSFAARGLDTCRDLADDVWDEFMRQAIIEIYQGQQARVRDVKNNCLDVVNECYDTQSKSLKDFSKIKESLLLGARLELSEQLCREKLDACSNLYGGGSNGLQELLTAMSDITDQKIAKECSVLLQDFAKETCAVPSNDTLHSYPYACRVYAPGTQQYANNAACNQMLWNEGNSGTSPILPPPTIDGSSAYLCPEIRQYSSCNEGYYMAYNGRADSTPKPGNTCLKCPDGATCTNGKLENECGNYVGSLYQKLVRYAMQTCTRPSNATSENPTIPETVLQDVNVVMDKIRVEMAKSLAAECDRLGGTWIDTPYNNYNNKYEYFYKETGANDEWGYCANKNQ